MIMMDPGGARSICESLRVINDRFVGILEQREANYEMTSQLWSDRISGIDHLSANTNVSDLAQPNVERENEPEQ